MMFSLSHNEEITAAVSLQSLQWMSVEQKVEFRSFKNNHVDQRAARSRAGVKTTDTWIPDLHIKDTMSPRLKEDVPGGFRHQGGRFGAATGWERPQHDEREDEGSGGRPGVRNLIRTVVQTELEQNRRRERDRDNKGFSNINAAKKTTTITLLSSSSGRVSSFSLNTGSDDSSSSSLNRTLSSAVFSACVSVELLVSAQRSSMIYLLSAAELHSSCTCTKMDFCRILCYGNLCKRLIISLNSPAPLWLLWRWRIPGRLLSSNDFSDYLQ